MDIALELHAVEAFAFWKLAEFVKWSVTPVKSFGSWKSDQKRNISDNLFFKVLYKTSCFFSEVESGDGSVIRNVPTKLLWNDPVFGL